jgi:hypothetical protein
VIELPPDHELAQITDWVETSCLFGRRGGVSKSDIEDALGEQTEEQPEEIAADVWEEIDRRSSLCGEGYPVDSGLARVRRRGPWTDFLPYTFLLSISCARHYRLWIEDRPARLLDGVYPERVFGHAVAIALEGYLDGCALRFDSPREPPVPSAYDEAVGFVAGRIDEEIGKVPTYREDPKDEHLDVIGWIPFSDRRPGKLIVLVQCATGTRWEDKLTELDTHAWSKYIDWPRDPLKAFALPFVIPEGDGDPDLWMYSSVHGGIILDRLRLTSCLGRASSRGGRFSQTTMVAESMRATTEALAKQLPWSN